LQLFQYGDLNWAKPEVPEDGKLVWSALSHEALKNSRVKALSGVQIVSIDNPRWNRRKNNKISGES